MGVSLRVGVRDHVREFLQQSGDSGVWLRKGFGRLDGWWDDFTMHYAVLGLGREVLDC